MKLLTLTFLATMSALSFATIKTSATLALGANRVDGVVEQGDLDPTQIQRCLGELPAQGVQPLDVARAALAACLIGQEGTPTADQVATAMRAMRDLPAVPKT